MQFSPSLTASASGAHRRLDSLDGVRAAAADAVERSYATGRPHRVGVLVTQALGMVGWLMTARASGELSAEAPTIEALIEALDPEVRAAIDDVDRTLIALSLEQSPWSRLRSATRMAQTVVRIRDAIASQGG